MGISEQLIYVVIVLGLLVAGLFLTNRTGTLRWPAANRSQTPKRMELVERLSLTPSHSVHLLRVDGRLLIVGVSPSGCQLLETASPDGAAGAKEIHA